METTYYGTAAERWERARMFFEAKDYYAAARVLDGLVDEVPEQTGPRPTPARAYYHSAQLRGAEAELCAIVERDPVEHYARLLLRRTLQRQGRDDEAERHLRSPRRSRATSRRCEPPAGPGHPTARARVNRARAAVLMNRGRRPTPPGCRRCVAGNPVTAAGDPYHNRVRGPVTWPTGAPGRPLPPARGLSCWRDGT